MRAPNYEFGGCEFESHQSFKIKFARVGELAYPSELGSELSVGSSPTLGTIGESNLGGLGTAR